MPSIKTTTPILGDNYYHIFNRGVNKQNIFYTEANYSYFLKLLDQFLTGYVDFLAFSLMPNHFHIILRILNSLDFNTILFNEELKNRSLFRERFFTTNLSDQEVIGKLVVRQLKKLFITYSMAINKQENRVGNLFDPKYKRLQINDQDYLKYAIFYTNYNPEKHGIIDDFKKYRYSSFQAIIGKNKTKINRELVFELFGDENSFLNYHTVMHDERDAIIIE